MSKLYIVKVLFIKLYIVAITFWPALQTKLNSATLQVKVFATKMVATWRVVLVKSVCEIVSKSLLWAPPVYSGFDYTS